MKKINIVAIVILAIMFALMLGSVWNDSAIFDETAHIAAGYSYITQLDYRLNPEHPPLIKALAGLSTWLMVRPNFPTDTAAWQNDINGQWEQGAAFLYHSGNDADRIIFWSRFPIILLALALGWLIFDWTRKRFGITPAFLTLIFYAFSPTILAHSRYVTTDIGAAFGFFIGIASFLAFLENPDRQRTLYAGLCFGIALLLKFSTVLLIPVYAIMLAAWIASRTGFFARQHLRAELLLLGKTILIGIIGLAVVWAAYALFTLNYPPERELRDAYSILGSYGFKPALNLDLALIRNPILRPLGEYLFGVLMAQQRAAGGNTSYFLGEVSAAGSYLYFPLLYLLKESLALHALSLIALALAIAKTKKITGILQWIRTHMAEVACISCIAVYWIFSVRSPLNIGIRHLLPTFPFIYILVARTIGAWLHGSANNNPQTIREWLAGIWEIFVASIPKYAAISILLLWLVASALGTAPYFLSYYNELVGTRYGYTIAVDSNYDWGQDLIRLKQYMERHDIQKIAVDYFGGGNPAYYLGNRFEPWWSARGAPPSGQWLAVSVGTLQSAYSAHTRGIIQKPEDSYAWLKPYRPVARVGTSILLYKLP